MDDTSGEVHDLLYVNKTTCDPDTLYPHDAMNTHDWTKFRITMQKELDGRMNGKITPLFTNHKSPRQP